MATKYDTFTSAADDDAIEADDRRWREHFAKHRPRVETTKHAIVIHWQGEEKDQHRYEIPLDRIHEPDWLDHIEGKIFGPAALDDLREALRKARAARALQRFNAKSKRGAR